MEQSYMGDLRSLAMEGDPCKLLLFLQDLSQTTSSREWEEIILSYVQNSCVHGVVGFRLKEMATEMTEALWTQILPMHSYYIEGGFEPTYFGTLVYEGSFLTLEVILKILDHPFIACDERLLWEQPAQLDDFLQFSVYDFLLQVGASASLSHYDQKHPNPYVLQVYLINETLETFLQDSSPHKKNDLLQRTYTLLRDRLLYGYPEVLYRFNLDLGT